MELRARSSNESVQDRRKRSSIHFPNPKVASCRPSIPPRPNLLDMRMIWQTPWACWGEHLAGQRHIESRIDSPIRILPPQMLVANYVNDLPINLVLSHSCLVGVNQDISSPLHPDGIAKPRRELDKDSLLIWKRAGI